MHLCQNKTTVRARVASYNAIVLQRTLLEKALWLIIMKSLHFVLIHIQKDIVNSPL